MNTTHPPQGPMMYGQQQQQQGGRPGVAVPGMPLSQPQMPSHGCPSSMAQGMAQGMAEPPPLPPSSVMKLTRGHSCVLCQQRKVRCDKNKPCANCVKAQVECRVVPPQPPRRRKKRPHERELVDRLRKYESLLSQHGVAFDPIAHEFKQGGDPLLSSELDDLQHDLGELKTSPSSGTYGESSGQFHEYRSNDDTLQDSSDEEVEGSTIHHAYDGMFETQDGFPFVVGGAPARVTADHPSGIQIFQLWQIYLTNVNPLLKITHTPTLQAQIIEAGTNVANIPPPLEALMFSIYFIAITSMSEEDVQSTFDEDRARLLAKFHRACQQALTNASFMRSPDIMVLQAYVLYLLSVRPFVDPRSLFCLIGIAVRIAQRLGYHRDGAQFGLPPVEVELRRRLWWQIVIFDKRFAEVTGSAITALSSSHGDTQMPLNINDTDLHSDAKDPPTPYAGPTEMLFCLTRIELCKSSQAATAVTGDSPKSVNNDTNAPSASHATNNTTAASTTPAVSGLVAAARKFHYSPNPSSPDVITHIASHTLTGDDTEGYCRYLEDTYLRSCDTKVPLHLLTLMMTRQAMCKLRIMSLLVRGAAAPVTPNTAGSSPAMASPAGNPYAAMMGGGGGMMGGMMGMGMGMGDPGAGPPSDTPNSDGRSGNGTGTGASFAPNLDDADRERLFLEAIHMLEYDNIVQSAPQLRGLVWYTVMHVPLPAYMVVVMMLRSRRTDTKSDLVDRAWTAVCENHDRRGLARKLRNPLHMAFGALYIKAWDAHAAAAAALQNGGQQRLKTPAFIRFLKASLHKINPAAAAALVASQQARQASGQQKQVADDGSMPLQQALPQTGSSGGGGGGEGKVKGQAQKEQHPQQQQHQHPPTTGHRLSTASSTNSSPPVAQHRQQHQPMVYATTRPPSAHPSQHQQLHAQQPQQPQQSQPQQPQQPQQLQQPQQPQQPQHTSPANTFDSMPPMQPMGVGVPDMLGFAPNPMDWGAFVPGPYGDGYEQGGPGGPDAGYGGGYVPMYGHGE